MGAALPAAELFWLEPQLAALRRARESGRFPHALLVQDAPGCGGSSLATAAAQLLLCKAADAPCGQCASCRRIADGTHPDFYHVMPEEDSQQVKVDQVRALSESLALSSHSGGGAAAIIEPAEALNANAANALLKTLEEPRPGVLIVLVSAAPGRLPATVRSRCQRLALRRPARAAAAKWLAERRGPADWESLLDLLEDAPLRALAVEDPRALLALRNDTHAQLEACLRQGLDPAATAERWVREGYELRLQCLENWVTRRIEWHCRGGRDVTELPTGAHLPPMDSTMNIRGLMRFADAAHELVALATTPLNKGLALEQLLWQLQSLRTGTDAMGSRASGIRR
jgi:DNA polymerase-3 subunit delta'